MLYIVIDDGKQATMYPCSSDEQMNAVALPANGKGHKIYGFPTEKEARAAFPGLVVQVPPAASPSGCGGKAAAAMLVLIGLGSHLLSHWPGAS